MSLFDPTFPQNHEPLTWKTRVPADISDWPKNKRIASIQSRVDAYIALPIFTYDSGVVTNPSRVFCVAQYNYTLAEPFAFKQYQLINMARQNNEGTYTLVVRWRTSDGVTHRKKIWYFYDNSLIEFTGKFNYIVPYAGETIPRNFTLEVWTIAFFFNPVRNLTEKILPVSISYPVPANGDSSGRIAAGAVISSCNAYDGAPEGFNPQGFPVPIPIDSRVPYITN